MRSKLFRWSVPGIPRNVETLAFKRFALLAQWCQPKILSAYFRTLWNGWATDRWLANMLASQGKARQGCVLRCGWDEDSLEHYSCCRLFWSWASSSRPFGLGIPAHFRSRASFMLLNPELSVENAVRLGIGIYAMQMTVQHCRHEVIPVDANIGKLLSLWAKRGAESSRAKALLRFNSPV